MTSNSRRRINAQILFVLATLATLPVSSALAENENVVLCDEGVILEPVSVPYGSNARCQLETVVDIDQFVFEGEADDAVRILVRGQQSNLEPRLTVRDPQNKIIAQPVCQTSQCTIDIPLQLALSGEYRLAINDVNFDASAASYLLQIERVPPEFQPPRLLYGPTQNGVIDSFLDVDFFVFDATAGTDAILIVSGPGGSAAPQVVVFDTSISELASGFCDSAPLGSCSFSIPLNFQESGTHLILVGAGNMTSGEYELSIQCLSGGCPEDLDKDSVPDIVDNCYIEPNLDQQDADGDGLGNQCDADLNNDCEVNFADLGEMKSVFFSSDTVADLNGDGSVNFGDLGIMKASFFEPPGPSGLMNICEGH